MIAFQTVNLTPSTGCISSNPGASRALIGSESFLARASCSAFFIGPNSYNVVADMTMKIKIRML